MVLDPVVQFRSVPDILTIFKNCKNIWTGIEEYNIIEMCIVEMIFSSFHTLW